METTPKTKEELEALLADDSLSADLRAKVQTMLDEEDFLLEGMTVTLKSIRESAERHRDTLDYLAKN